MIKRKISPDTEKKYNKIVHQLNEEFLQTSKYGHIYAANPIDFVRTLLQKGETMRPKSFLTYKSALLWWLAQQRECDEVFEAQEFLKRNTPSYGYKNEKGEWGTTSLYSAKSSRPRTVSRKKFQKALDELTALIANAKNSRQAKRASELRYWLIAGLATGLRPVEWEAAMWEDKSKGMLRVKTAKRKVSYALPDIQHLQPPPIDQSRFVFVVDANDCFWVDLHLKSVQRHLKEGKSFQSYYDNNRVYLHRLCKAIFPYGEPHLTLYTLRGQFAANRKRSGQSREELGQEMGCGAHYTSTAYGSKIYGHKSIVPNSWKPQVRNEALVDSDTFRHSDRE